MPPFFCLRFLYLKTGQLVGERCVNAPLNLESTAVVTRESLEIAQKEASDPQRPQVELFTLLGSEPECELFEMREVTDGMYFVIGVSCRFFKHL